MLRPDFILLRTYPHSRPRTVRENGAAPELGRAGTRTLMGPGLAAVAAVAFP